MNKASASAIQPHNQKPASVWNSGGAGYEEISRGIADSIEHAVLRLRPRPGERVLDLATGTGWASRLVARRGATVIGVDLGEDLIRSARERARAAGLDIEYRVGDAACPLRTARSTRSSTCRNHVRQPPERRRVRIGPRDPQGWEDFDLKFERGTSFYREPSGEAAWDAFSTSYGPTRALANSLDESRLADLRRDFIAFHDGFSTELGICMPREYLLTVGVRR